MEKIQLKDERKNEYKKLIQTAQSIEAAVGGAYCKLNKMVDVRRQIDNDLKNWWDQVSEENKIDKTKDYFVDQNGDINLADVTGQGSQAAGGNDGGASEDGENPKVKTEKPSGEEVKEVPVAGTTEEPKKEEGVEKLT